jgi:hypothetical protein
MASYQVPGQLPLRRCQVPFGPSDFRVTPHKTSFVHPVGTMRGSMLARRILSASFLALASYLLLFSLPRPGADTASQFIAVPARPLWPLASAVSVSNANRAVYPYSVIPGGAESSEELRQAADTDPVVAEHYSDFNISRVRRVTLNAPQLVYVSYRVGNSVYWTKNKLMLAKGEAVLTDGRSMARVRCGNRISVAPVRPNLATEPSVEDFNAPIFPPSLSTPYLAASSVPPAGFPPGQSSEISASPGSPSVPFAPFFPLPGGGGGSGKHPGSPPPGGGGGTPPPGGGGTPPPGGGGGTPPPVGIPEPGTGILVLVGLGGAWLVRRNKKTANV